MPLILTDATNNFKNSVKRMRSGPLRERARAAGKENMPLGQSTASSALPNIIVTAASRQKLLDHPSRWEPKNGKIIIKVSVKETDDIWRFKVPHDISLCTFQDKVEHKVGFPVYFVRTPGTFHPRITNESEFSAWVAGRIQDGRNTPLTAHPVKLSDVPLALLSRPPFDTTRISSRDTPRLLRLQGSAEF